MPRTLFLFFNCHLCGRDFRRGLSSFQWLLFSMFLTIVNVLYAQRFPQPTVALALPASFTLRIPHYLLTAICMIVSCRAAYP